MADTQSKKKIYLLSICLCVSLCACRKTDQGSESVSQETEQNISQESEQVFLDKYNDVFAEVGAKRAALFYLDQDSVPELLILKDGEYQLYTFDGSEVKAITMQDSGIKASAYGLQHDFQDSDYRTFYRFEYVPYKKLVRVHNSTEEDRNDYYLRYADGLLTVELKAQSAGYEWYTYDAEGETENEEFLTGLSDLGYDGLIPCEYLYDNIADAYENIGLSSDSRKVLDDFVSGRIDAVDYVEEIGDIPEEGFVMKSYDEYFEYMTAGDEAWIDAIRTEYIDFDNDGEDEMVMHGFAGSRLFLDVIGDIVYKVLHTYSTTDVAYVAEMAGRRVIARTDLSHSGRKYYWIMEFDSCCCLVDWFSLNVSYEGESYSEEDMFMYREREISMEEFEKIRDSIQSP